MPHPPSHNVLSPASRLTPSPWPWCPDPYEDGTDGFFVAVFQRVSSAGHADKSAEGAAEARGPAAPLLGAGASAAGEAAEEAAEEARRARLAEKRKRKKQRQKEAKKRAATAGGDEA